MAYNKKPSLSSLLRAKQEEPKPPKKPPTPEPEDLEISRPLGSDAPRESERTKLRPNKGNGCNLKKYRWTQTMETLELKVPFKTPVRARDLTIKIGKKRLFVGINGKTPIIDDLLYDDVEHEECMWELPAEKEGKLVVITLQKPSRYWWSALVKSDPEISRSLIDEGPGMDPDEMNAYFSRPYQPPMQ